MNWARMLAYITGTVDQELLLRNEYLAAENRCASSELNAAPFRLRWLLAWMAAALSRAVFDGCDYSKNERERSPNRIQT
jgi:hypothetical protein